MIELPFRDRNEAGRLLGAELAARGFGSETTVVALTRGGLPLGVAVAERLKAPLDIIVVRKLGVPWHPELAMGALAGGIRVVDEELIRDLGMSYEEVDAVAAREAAEMKRREQLYRNGGPASDLRGKTVALIDDGLATGSTMLAAATAVRRQNPARVIVAVPVGSKQACHRLAQEADECICLALPEPFLAVGEWYIDFPQVSDAEVQAMLERFHHPIATG